jgi:hypothetical protein
VNVATEDVAKVSAFGAPYLLRVRDSADGSAAVVDGGLATARTIAAVALTLCGYTEMSALRLGYPALPFEYSRWLRLSIFASL